MYTAKWNNYDGICACADTIENAVGAVLFLTSGDGDVLVYDSDNIFVKKYQIKN